MSPMKTTKKNVLLFVREKLATDPVWARKALVKIYTENQTSQEQAAEQTVEDNGIGFSGVDANFLSSLAKQFIEKGYLSDKQMKFVFKKIKKYAGQVVQFSDKARLEKMVEEAELLTQPNLNLPAT